MGPWKIPDASGVNYTSIHLRTTGMETSLVFNPSPQGGGYAIDELIYNASPAGAEGQRQKIVFTAPSLPP